MKKILEFLKKNGLLKTQSDSYKGSGSLSEFGDSSSKKRKEKIVI